MNVTGLARRGPILSTSWEASDMEIGKEPGDRELQSERRTESRRLCRDPASQQRKEKKTADKLRKPRKIPAQACGGVTRRWTGYVPMLPRFGRYVTRRIEDQNFGLCLKTELEKAQWTPRTRGLRATLIFL
jgi:hypothetical protein